MATGTQKPPAAPARGKRPNDAKTIALALAGIVIVVAFFLNVLPGPEQEILPEPPPEETVAKRPEPKPVQLAPRPERLFHETLQAIIAKDRRALLKALGMQDPPVEEILADDRPEQLGTAYANRRMKVTESVIDGTKARWVAVFENSRGLEIEEIVFEMQQMSGVSEDWKVVKILNKWGPGSSRTREGGFAAIGPNRTPVAYVPKAEPEKQQFVEAEPVANLPYPAGTTDAQKSEIEAQVKLLLDKDKPAQANAAAAKLMDIGKAAIPPLLNALATLDTRKEDQDKTAFVIDRVLAGMSLRQMGYPGGGIVVNDALPAEARVRAIRRWFGWWQSAKDKPLLQKGSLGAEDIDKGG